MALLFIELQLPHDENTLALLSGSAYCQNIKFLHWHFIIHNGTLPKHLIYSMARCFGMAQSQGIKNWEWHFSKIGTIGFG
jgi:hypothetical protein